jgi:hypothetical protein
VWRHVSTHTVIIRPIFEPCFKVHQVTAHIHGIPKSLQINESLIIDRYCYNIYFLKIYPFSFKWCSHLATHFIKLRTGVQAYMKSKWSLSSQYANIGWCFPSCGLLHFMFLLLVRRSVPLFIRYSVNTRLRYASSVTRGRQTVLISVNNEERYKVVLFNTIINMGCIKFGHLTLFEYCL